VAVLAIGDLSLFSYTNLYQISDGLSAQMSLPSSDGRTSVLAEAMATLLGRKINLTSPGHGMPGLTPANGTTLTESAVACLEDPYYRTNVH
jgi:hypothetical protein